LFSVTLSLVVYMQLITRYCMQLDALVIPRKTSKMRVSMYICKT
jgi:hypothetical protein